MNPKENRKKMSEIMFENYGWAHLNIQVQVTVQERSGPFDL